MPIVHSLLRDVNVTAVPSISIVQLSVKFASVVRVPWEARPLRPRECPSASVHVALTWELTAGPPPVAPARSKITLPPAVTSTEALPAGAADAPPPAVTWLGPGPPAPALGTPPTRRIARRRTRRTATSPQ